jgi:hypothetical protein
MGVQTLTVSRIDRVVSRGGRPFLKVFTPTGIYYAEPGLSKELRPGATVEVETAEDRGVRLIKAVKVPDLFALPDWPPDRPDGEAAPAGANSPAETPAAGEAPGPARAWGEGSAAPPTLKAEAPAGAPTPLKVLALEGALRLLSARGRPFDVEELLGAAERIYAWLKA